MGISWIYIIMSGTCDKTVSSCNTRVKSRRQPLLLWSLQLLLLFNCQLLPLQASCLHYSLSEGDPCHALTAMPPWGSSLELLLLARLLLRHAAQRWHALPHSRTALQTHVS